MQQTEGSTLSWERAMGTAIRLLPRFPSTGGVTSLMSLSITVCYTKSFCTPLPWAAPQPTSIVNLYSLGKPSKALIGVKKKLLQGLPSHSFPSSSAFSLVLYSTSLHTQIMLWKSFTICQLKKKRKKKRKEKKIAGTDNWQLPEERNSFQWRIWIEPWIHSYTVSCPPKQ